MPRPELAIGGDTVSGRRFRELSHRSASGSLESERAHENLLAINADLRRQIATLEQSTSFRLGRLLLRLLQPVFSLLRIKRFSNRSPVIRIESCWPRLTGTITLHQRSAELVPVRVTSASEELLAESIDTSSRVDPGTPGPWTSAFEFRYPLGFQAFRAAELRVRIAGTEMAIDPPPPADSTTPRILRPIDIATDSIIEVRGDPAALRSKISGGKPVAILSTFRDVERVDAVPRLLMSALADEGFSLVVVDTSSSLPDGQTDEEMVCDLLIHRRNIGWDFASWLSTLASYPWILDEASELLIINDSNVGPLRPIGDVFARGRLLDVDIWGLTDSWDISHHLQSYFLHFNTRALRSGHLRDFVDSFTFPVDKARIIGTGEIGLSRFMRSRGLSLGALYPYTELAATFMESVPQRVRRVVEFPENELQREFSLLEFDDELQFVFDTAERIRTSAPVNPTHYFWDILLDMGSPFVKRELLAKNPDLVSGLHRLPAHVPDAALEILEEEVRTWPRTPADFSLPLALRWQPTTGK